MMLKNQINSFLCLCMFWGIFTRAHAQDSLSVPPKISIISSYSVFLDTVITRSNNKYIGGGVVLPTVTIYKSLMFEIDISIIMHHKGDIPDLPLSAKIISPEGKQQIFPLLKNISALHEEMVYDFNFNFSTNERNWYKIQIGTFEILPVNILPKYNIIFDERNIRI